jgi:hypothetical protein
MPKLRNPFAECFIIWMLLNAGAVVFGLVAAALVPIDDRIETFAFVAGPSVIVAQLFFRWRVLPKYCTAIKEQQDREDRQNDWPPPPWPEAAVRDHRAGPP